MKRLPLTMRGHHVRRLTRAAAEAAPREACGVLLGETIHRERLVRRLTVARNLSPAPRRFFLDPAHLLRQEEAVAARRLEILGVWHSHLGAPARPSHLDLEGTPSTWIQLITRMDDGVVTDLRAWETVEGQVQETRVFVDDDLHDSSADGRPHAHAWSGAVAGWAGPNGGLQA